MLRIEGAQEIRAVARSLDLSAAGAEDKASAIVRKSAFAVESGAKLRVPVRTHNLQNSINVWPERPKLLAIVGAEAEYGGYVEKGTWKMEPQPYLGPAFDEVEPSFVAALADLGAQALG